MSRQERCEVLKDIARDPDSYPSSRVSASRLLSELDPLETEGGFEPTTVLELRRSGNRSR